jgi:hypothetical protein
MAKEKIGVDVINWRPDYTKSNKENIKDFRENYEKVYKEKAPKPSKSK